MFEHGLSGVESQKFWSVENLDEISESQEKLPENSGQMAPKVVWFHKMTPNVCRNTWRRFVGVSPQEEDLHDLKYSSKIFSGKFGEIWTKRLRTAKTLPSPTPMNGLYITLRFIKRKGSEARVKVYMQRGQNILKPIPLRPGDTITCCRKGPQNNHDCNNNSEKSKFSNLLNTVLQAWHQQ